MANPDYGITARFREQCEAARAHLWHEMEARGLHRRDGWSIHESTRAAGNGTALVFTPMHLRLRAPVDLECWVQVDEESHAIASDCEPHAHFGNYSP